MLLRSLSVCVIAVALMTSSWRPAAAGRQGVSPYLVVIVMDGFRPDYATLAPMHHLRALIAEGMTYDTAWVGQMESETPTGHATIGTGVYPRKHGIVGFGFRLAPNPAFTYMPTDIGQIAAGNLTRLIEQGGVPTISDLIHARNRQDLTVSISGEKYYASATMGADANYVLYGKDRKGTDGKTRFRPTPIGPNVPPGSTQYSSVTVPDSTFDTQDQFASSLAVQLLRTLRPRALLLNLPATDIAGHYYGGMRDPQDMTSIIKGADSAIGRVVAEYKRLGLFNRTLFVVTADHGMASNRHIVPIHPMYNAVAATQIPTLDEEFRISVGSIWLRDPSQAPALASALATKRFPGVEGVLYRTPSASGGTFAAEPSTAARLPHGLIRAYVDLANTEAGPTGPDVLLPYGEDTLGLVVKHSKSWGSHGGFSWGVQHIPLVLVGPDVRHGTSHFPAKLVDIAPTIERLLGLPIPQGVDGLVLSDALSNATADERKAQAAAQGPRLADVNALRAHSAQQSAQAHH